MLLKEKDIAKKSALPLSVSKNQQGLLIDSGLILVIAVFLRFYLIQTTEFDADQAILFRMAYDAVHYGLFPVTSNIASIGIPHPPGVIYLYMIPALFSSNPLGGALLVSICSTLAVLLTYLFGRRYFGRACGLIAALLFAAAATPLNYSRFIWQPNLMPLFVILYLFALFRGVYDRRPGWLLCALPLLGMLYQTHPTSVLLAVLLLVALILAPGTVRWYDWLGAVLILAVIFLPYLVYLGTTHLADIRMLFTLAKQPAHVDDQALNTYWNFIKPFGSFPAHSDALLTRLTRKLPWIEFVPIVLVIGGVLLVVKGIWGSGQRTRPESGETRKTTRLYALLEGWRTFRADPVRCGMALLLLWQVIPLLVLSRHQVDLQVQYLFILLPGPFLLIALFLTWLIRGASWRWPEQKFVRAGVIGLLVLFILTQLAGGTAMVLDRGYGHYNDNAFYPYYDALSDMQEALARTDQVADEYHIQRVFIASDVATTEALHFLVPQMKHQATLFDTPACFVLPAVSTGPVIVLANPFNPLATILLQRFANAKLLETLPRQAGDPYKLYLVSTPTRSTPLQTAFPGSLALTQTQGETLSAGPKTWLVSHWEMQQTEPQAFRTTYGYSLTATSGEQQLQSSCSMTSMQAGDQLLMTWRLSAGTSPAPRLNIQGSYNVSRPVFSTFGPLRLDTYHFDTQTQQLKSGAQGITLSTEEKT